MADTNEEKTDPQSADTNEEKTDPQSWGEVWAQLKPWDDKPTRFDITLLVLMVAIPAFYLVMLPLRPFLIANIPLVLTFVTGGRTVIGGAGAFAAVGEFPLWAVIVLGTLGFLKFSWIFWLVGYRWGEGVFRTFAAQPPMSTWVRRLRNVPTWIMWVFVLIGRLPFNPIPSNIVGMIMGWKRNSFWLYLLADVLGALGVAAGMAWIGYAIGQPAVDLISQIDSYAIWVTLAIIFGMAFWGARRAQKAQQATEERKATGAERPTPENEE
ncbi:DedA family protein [Brevibacterium litoralis]|uniref:DedA family protein n=1 Tax=Brevibacterium litoralis TaxID=3138935 RepID=UPI0032EFADFF